MSSGSPNRYLKQHLKFMQDSLRHTLAENEELKDLINEMVLDKQTLKNDLFTSKVINEKLVTKIDRQRDRFNEYYEESQAEMQDIKMTLGLMQSLHVSNRKLARHMSRCARTRFRLGAMFLRMRSTKRRCESSQNRYQQMCFQFASYVREQNLYLSAVTEAKMDSESISSCHGQYLDLLTRCSQLLHENMNLRLLAMAQKDENRTGSLVRRSERAALVDTIAGCGSELPSARNSALPSEEKKFHTASDRTNSKLKLPSSKRYRPKSV
ncbi:uncharacterized protein LOC129750131 isoform X2 [Uranotaenia lowii]|uniref:uncharacterized protein LOC129750131 isoform X2 n=1 Tax=Uranotaenia lowii TaxID=190385 RepID=UPI002478459D|nr:uncharacterized protein LOC129750131 isoform X2 [Uranotaenia lowii]